MIVFGASISPYVRKVLVFGAEKGLELENKPLGFDSDDPGFRAASPFRKIPAFEDGDFRIADSSAIIAYLDAIRPEPNLVPTEARARARCVWWDEFADTLLVGWGRAVVGARGAGGGAVRGVGRVRRPVADGLRAGDVLQPGGVADFHGAGGRPRRGGP